MRSSLAISNSTAADEDRLNATMNNGETDLSISSNCVAGSSKDDKSLATDSRIKIFAFTSLASLKSLIRASAGETSSPLNSNGKFLLDGRTNLLSALIFFLEDSHQLLYLTSGTILPLTRSSQ